MIDFVHDSFFTLANKETQDYIEIGSCTESNVILHPNFSFDPTPGGGYARNIEMEIIYEEPTKREHPKLDNNIQIMPNELYHQKFRTRQAIDPAFLRDFIEGCKDFFALNAFPDEILWYETGYWSIKDCRKQFMGIGVNALEQCHQTISADMVMFCLANRDSIVILHGSLNKNSKTPATDIDIYTTNAFLPFTEVADLYRSSIRKLRKVENLTTEFILESTIHSQYSPRCLFPLHPKAFVMMESYPVLAVIENPTRKSTQPLASLERIIGPVIGGFMEGGSANSKRRFWLRINQWKLDDITLFEFFFMPFQNWYTKRPRAKGSRKMKGLP